MEQITDKMTLKIFEGQCPRGFEPDLFDKAETMLCDVVAATSLESLNATPGRRLEKLPEFGKNVRSIRINRKWRIMFEWVDGKAYRIKVVKHR